MGANVAIRADVAARLIGDLRQQQSELHRVARVLHEETGQILTVVGLQLDVLRQDFGEKVPELGQRASEIQQMLEKAIDGVRQLSYSLNPDRVQRSGLRYALDLLVGQAREKSQANIRFLMDSHVHLPLPAAFTIYRITECALENAVSHSGAQQIEVVLQPTSHSVRLEVKDNGCGFDVEDAEKNPVGTGLLWIRHLAQEQELELKISSRIGGGTAVHAVCKLPEVGPVGG